MKRHSNWIFVACGLLLSGASAAPYNGLVLPVREVTISSLVEGRIESLAVREGDRIEKGAPLVHLFAGMEELEARRSAAAVEKREFEYKSSKNLFDEQVISEDEAMESRIELDLAKLTLEMAEERVAMRRLEAPITGIVVERHFEEGEMVRPAEPILEVVDLTEVFVQFYVESDRLSEVSVGQMASVMLPSLGRDLTFEGPVDFIDPRVDAASGLSRVRVRLQNSDQVIKAGLRAKVDLIAMPETAGN
ncbi:MAG: efflux RND transporter periplasmic adaptor subunit [Opitutales bacterium]